MNSQFSREQLFIIASATLLIIDQVIKELVVRAQPLIEYGFLRIVLVTNTGASFGMLQQNNWLFIIISLLALGGIIGWWKKIPHYAKTSTIIISGGILSNVIDRVMRGHVIDYLGVGWWPVFNIADSMIVLGAISIMIASYKEERAHKKRKRSKKQKMAREEKLMSASLGVCPKDEE